MGKEEYILIVNPWIHDFSAYDHFMKPLGIVWLSSYLKKYFEIEFLNLNPRIHPLLPKKSAKPDGRGPLYNQEIEKPEILKFIPRKFKRYGIPPEIAQKEIENIIERRKKSPKYIFITSFMTYWYTGVKETVEFLKKFFPNTKIVLGGIYATLLPEHAKKVINPDYIILGQYIYHTLPQILKLLNIEEKHIGKLKVPEYSFFTDRFFVPLILSQGCIYRCTYCASHILSSTGIDGRTFFEFPATFGLSQVKKALKLGFYKFAFYDDALLVNYQNRLKNFFKLLDLEGITGKVEFYTPNALHARFITKEIAEDLITHNVKEVRLGLEFTTEKDLIDTGRKVLLKEFEEAVRLLHEVGYKPKDIKVYLLVGLPWQDISAVEKGLDYVVEKGATPMLAYYTPIPKTQDFQKTKQLYPQIEEPLLQNNTSFLYLLGDKTEKILALKQKELEYRKYFEYNH